VVSQTITAYYERPLTIESAFVRVTTTSNGVPIYGGGLDYPISILSLEEYESIGLKIAERPMAQGHLLPAIGTAGNHLRLAKPRPGRNAPVHANHFP
jgi:hypothetical protein